MTPSAALLGHLRPGASNELSPEVLEGVVADLISRAAARWPELPIDPTVFAAAIGERVASTAALASLRAEDLHLAVACALGVRGALAAFDELCLDGRSLSAALKRIDPSPGFVEEVRQAVRERLFTPPPGRIAEYGGRGSLIGWTRVTAIRIALRLRPRPTRNEEPGAAVGAAEADQELRLLMQKHGRQFEDAVNAAFALLDDEQHNLLRLQVVDGLGTAQIAALFGVDRSTIKRRLASCRSLLTEHTRKALREALGLSTESFESLARTLVSALDISVVRLLNERE